jgi:hypothetical protein
LGCGDFSSSWLKIDFIGSSGPVAVRVGYAPGAGRGVFAVLDIAVGDLIHTADPVVAHPALASMQKEWK